MSKACTVEEALEKVGEYGRYQKLLDLVFCLLNMPVAIQILMMTFATVTPTWMCDSESSAYINCTQKMFNNSLPQNHTDSIFEASDLRRCTIPLGSWKYTQPKEFSLVTQFDIDCDRKWVLQLLQSIFFVGWALGAFVLGAVGDKYGRKALMYPAFTAYLTFAFICSFLPNIYAIVFCRFVIGFCLHGTSTQAYILISEVVGSKHRPFACLVIFLFTTVGWAVLDLKAYLLQNWKILNIVSTAPYIFVLLFYKITPESIQWLQSKGREEEVIEILRNIGKWNKKPLPNNVSIAPPEDTAKNERTSVIDLFRDRKLAVASLQQGYLWLVIAMGYYGLYMASNDLGGDFYGNFLYLNLVDLPALFVAMSAIDKIGRRLPTLAPMFIGGIFCTCVGITPKQGSLKVIRTVFGNIGKFFLCISFNGIYTWTVELYPTEVRSIGMGFTTVAARIGSTAAPWIAQGLQPVSDWLPFVVLGVPSIVGFFIGFPLPETKTKNIETTEPTAELENVGKDNLAYGKLKDDI